MTSTTLQNKNKNSHKQTEQTTTEPPHKGDHSWSKAPRAFEYNLGLVYAIENHFDLTSYIFNRPNNLLIEIKTQCRKLLKTEKATVKIGIRI